MVEEDVCDNRGVCLSEDRRDGVDSAIDCERVSIREGEMILTKNTEERGKGLTGCEEGESLGLCDGWDKTWNSGLDGSDEFADITSGGGDGGNVWRDLEDGVNDLGRDG